MELMSGMSLSSMISLDCLAPPLDSVSVPYGSEDSWKDIRLISYQPVVLTNTASKNSAKESHWPIWPGLGKVPRVQDCAGREHLPLALPSKECSLRESLFTPEEVVYSLSVNQWCPHQHRI